jgi:TPP-dependent 2-oxoacid decarboxylase
MLLTKNEQVVHYLTEEALYLVEKAIREEQVFYDDFDEWQGVTLPEALGGEEWDINISVYGEPFMRATAYPFHTYEHNGETITEIDTKAGVALLCVGVVKNEAE